MSLSLSETAYFCRSRQPAVGIISLLIIEQISKTHSFIPLPSPSSREEKMPCPPFIQMLSKLNNIVLLLRVLRRSLVLNAQPVHWQRVLFLLESFVHVILTASIQLCLCFSSRTPAGLLSTWLKWFLLRRSVKSNIPSGQWPGNHTTRFHFRDLAPHTCSLNWPGRASVMREREGETRGRRNPEGWGCVYLWMEVFFKLSWRFFIAFLEGNVQVITLYIPVAGPPTRASASERVLSVDVGWLT